MNFNKNHSYTPVISLKDLKDGRLQINCHVKEQPENGLTTFIINANFNSLSLSFDGLDCFIHEEGHDYILGSVSLNASYELNQLPNKELLADIKIKATPDKKLTATANLKRVRNSIIEAWEDALNHAFDSIADSKNTSTDSVNALKNIKFLKKKTANPLLTIAASVGFLLLLSYGGLSVYERYQNVVMTNNQNKLLDVAIDPEKISASEDALISKTLSEAGIDRSQLKNDMSCFSELPN